MSSGDDAFAAFSIKGLQGQRRSMGTRVNELGQTENLYQVVEDREWGEKDRSYEFEYVQWHQTYHEKQRVRDPRCTICQAEVQFEQVQMPHIENHRKLNRYDANCRFCQDDRFFGRM